MTQLTNSNMYCNVCKLKISVFVQSFIERVYSRVQRVNRDFLVLTCVHTPLAPDGFYIYTCVCVCVSYLILSTDIFYLFHRGIGPLETPFSTLRKKKKVV